MVDADRTQALEALAAEIGENIYIDVAKWHLYLADAHLHATLAERVYPLLEDRAIDERAVLEILRGIPVKLGGGKLEVPLADLLPMQSQVHLLDLLEDYQRNL